MDIFGWHGGWGNFASVNPRHLGTGEGNSQGWGFHFAENRAGGEYYAEWARRNRGAGFLHHVKLTLPKDRLWKDPDRSTWQLPQGRSLTYASYCILRQDQGDFIAATRLRSMGVWAFMLWEHNPPPHGHTFVVLELSAVSMIESLPYP